MRVLIAGGYGVVGAWIARELRAQHPDLELFLAGRNPENGAALAAEIGAKVAPLDVNAPADQLVAIGPVDVVVASLRDPGDNLAIAALKAGAGHISIVRPPETIAALAVAAELAGRPALVLGHWQAGVMSLCALAAARAFDTVDRIELSALYDYADPIGPMTATDSGAFFERQSLIRRGGDWVRVEPADDAHSVTREGAPEFMAQPMSVLDVPALAAVTTAPDIRFDLGAGASLGALAGGVASHDIYIDLWGRNAEGQKTHARAAMTDPSGQAHLTALGVLIGVERLLGLDGRPPLPGGLCFPESRIDPEAAMRRLRALGVKIEISDPAPVA